MATQHPEQRTPFDLISQMHISLKETVEFMKVDLEGMKSYWETHDMMNSDDRQTRACFVCFLRWRFQEE